MQTVTSYPEKNKGEKSNLLPDCLNFITYALIILLFLKKNFVSLWNVLIGNHKTYKLVTKL